MQKFIPKSPDPYIITSQDSTVARFGHINAIIDVLDTIINPSTSGIMFQSQYDPNNTGSVNNSRNFGGFPPSYYLLRSNHTGTQSQATIVNLISDLASKGDMFKNVYDSDNDGVVDNSEKLGNQFPAYYLDRVNHFGSQAISSITGLQTALNDKLDDSQLGVDIPTLVGGVIPVSQLPFSSSLYLGLYDASTNTPPILNGTGTAGEFYIASVIGNAYAPVNVTLVNQIVAYNGSVWEVGAVFTGSISDVNGQTGPTVTLDLDDIPDTLLRAAVTPAHADALTNAITPANASNPVATNADITTLSNQLASAGDMLKSVYDTNNNGVVDNSARLGGKFAAYYLDRLNHTGIQPQSSVDNLISDLASKIPASEKGANNGVCELDANGKVPTSRLNVSAINYQNSWRADINSPFISNGVGTQGDAYIVSVAGTQTLGGPTPISFNVGDLVIYNGTTWQRIAPTTGGIQSVNGITTPVLTLNADDIPQGPSNKFFLNTNQYAAVTNAAVPGGTNPFATINDLSPLESDITDLQNDISSVQSSLASKENIASKGIANGYAPLDSGGKIPNSFLNFSAINYQNSWNALTNTPTLSNGTGVSGQAYIVGVGGTQNLGSGAITFAVGDLVVHNGTVWQKITGAAPGVSSVNGFVGAVNLTADNIAETASRFYVSASQNAALDAATAASGVNRFATLADISATGVTLYITPDEFAYGHPIGDNTTRVLSTLINPATGTNYTNASAAVRWPLVAANAAWVGAINVNTMTIDWIAIQEAFLTMETSSRTSFLSPNGSRRYRVNNTIKLPRVNGTGVDTPITIDFNGSKVMNVSGTNFIVLDRFSPDQTTALNSWANYPLHLKGVIVEGNGVNTNLSNIGIRVAANIKGSYERVYSNAAAVNIALYFNLCVNLKNCQFTGCGLYSIVTADAASGVLGYSWPGATNSNSQCNHIQYDNVRCQPQSASTIISAFYHKGGYGHVIRDCNVENLGGTTQHVVFYEGSGDQIDHPIKISGLNFEISGNVSRALIRIRNEKGLSVIEYVTGYVNGTCNAFIEADNRGNFGGSPTIVVRDCENTTPLFAKLRSVITAGSPGAGAAYQYTWILENVGIPVWQDVFDSNNWVSSGAPVWDGVTPNSVVPTVDHMRYKALYFDLNQQSPLDSKDYPRVTGAVGSATPIGSVIPQYVGQIYVKTSAPLTVFAGTGTSNNTQWIALN